MARIRSIKPAFFTDEKIVECSIPARLLFIGMWVFADDAGRLEYSPKRLKMQIFPADDSVNTEGLVGELEKINAVVRYEVAGIGYLQIRNFLKHQKINRPQHPIWPDPPSGFTELQPPNGMSFTESHTELQGSFTELSLKNNGHSHAAKVNSLTDIDRDIDRDNINLTHSSKKEPDPRHAEFQKLLFRCHAYLNDGDKPPWDASDAKQLSLLLKAKPDLTTKQFHIWLGNYAVSENINPSSRPRRLLPKITEYAGGPLDKFGRVLQEKRAVL